MSLDKNSFSLLETLFSLFILSLSVSIFFKILTLEITNKKEEVQSIKKTLTQVRIYKNQKTSFLPVYKKDLYYSNYSLFKYELP